eukprot:9622994-Lingulodinium_polyedra.AAC.1
MPGLVRRGRYRCGEELGRRARSYDLAPTRSGALSPYVLARCPRIAINASPGVYDWQLRVHNV